MGEFNLLDQYPKSVRNIKTRKLGQSVNREVAKEFGQAYFDGTRDEGYGGYHYDGRWVPIAKKMVERYRLSPGLRVLDVGCAKGYLIKDLMDVCPGLDVWGLDISGYAIQHAHPDVQGRIVQGSVDALPFAENTFDAVVSINVVHNLELERCVRGIQEIARVAKPEKSYIQVDGYRNDSEKELCLNWVLTAVTHGTLEFWRELFAKCGYRGDYYWTILEIDPNFLILKD